MLYIQWNSIHPRVRGKSCHLQTVDPREYSVQFSRSAVSDSLRPPGAILPFHTVNGVLKARILKWFVIPISREPRFVRTLHHDPSVLGGPTPRGS